MSEFKFNEMIELEKEILYLAAKYPKHTKKFLQVQGNKLKQLAVKKAKSKVKKRSGNYLKGFKRGKVYKYNDEDTVRVYNSSSHSHLIEYGHVKKNKTGKEHGFQKGKFILEESKRDYNSKFVSEANNLIDEIIKDGGF